MDTRAFKHRATLRIVATVCDTKDLGAMREVLQDIESVLPLELSLVSVDIDIPAQANVIYQAGAPIDVRSVTGAEAVQRLRDLISAPDDHGRGS